MLYEPLPIGFVCRVCKIWKPRAELKRRKREKFGVEHICILCYRADHKHWRAKHATQASIQGKLWYKKHRNQQIAYSKHWRETHLEQAHAHVKHYRETHLEQDRAKSQRREARKRALPATFTDPDWRYALNYFNGACAYCGHGPSLFDLHFVLHQDHFVPLSKNGAYTPDNIVPACQSCNFSKHDSDPHEWLIIKLGKRKAKERLRKITEYFHSL